MAFGPIRQAQQQAQQQQEQQQELPLPHDDIEYIDQRFQAYYYNPYGVREVVSVDWNTRQHRVIFADGNQERSSIEVDRNFQITLREVLALKGVIIQRIEMVNLDGQNIPDTNVILNQPVEDMQPVGATIWSHDGPEDLPIDHEFIHYPLPEAAWEAAG
jgi:hypothetical protein